MPDEAENLNKHEPDANTASFPLPEDHAKRTSASEEGNDSSQSQATGMGLQLHVQRIPAAEAVLELAPNDEEEFDSAGIDSLNEQLDTSFAETVLDDDKRDVAENDHRSYDKTAEEEEKLPDTKDDIKKQAEPEGKGTTDDKTGRLDELSSTKPENTDDVDDAQANPGEQPPRLIRHLAKSRRESIKSQNNAAPKAKSLPSGRSFLAYLKQSLLSEFRPLTLNQENTENPQAALRRHQYLELRRQRGAAGTVLLLHALLTIILMILWAIFPRYVFGIDKLGLDGNMFSTLGLQGISVLIPSFLVMMLYNMDIVFVGGRTRQGPTAFVIAGLIGIPAGIAFSGINNLTLFALTTLGLHPHSGSLLGQLQSPSPLALFLLVLITAVIPAISEEIMFRGVIHMSLSLSGKNILAIVLTATSFALYHNNPSFLIAPFCAGLYLGFIRHKSDNLYVTILIHFIMNTTLVLLQPILPLFSSSMSFAGTNGRTALYTSLIAATVALVILIPLTSAFYANCEPQVPLPGKSLYRRLQQEEWFPADWKFLLALIILFITMVITSG